MDVRWRLRGQIFEWDAAKAELNYQRHGLDFFEAAEVFFDELALVEPDDEQSEARWKIIGVNFRMRLLLVVHTERGHRNRIISARVPTAHERRRYETE